LLQLLRGPFQISIGRIFLPLFGDTRRSGILPRDAGLKMLC
jgi:hypothetical protein